jgi:hypothetical protein
MCLCGPLVARKHRVGIPTAATRRSVFECISFFLCLDRSPFIYRSYTSRSTYVSALRHLCVRLPGSDRSR